MTRLAVHHVVAGAAGAIAVPPSVRGGDCRAVHARDWSTLMLTSLLSASLADVLFCAGAAHLGILIASSLVPFRLKWRDELTVLTLLHRQMYWVYGGYVVLSIVAFALISMFNAQELASGSGLARGLCFYVAVFWGVRVGLQMVFDVKVHLTSWWLTAGYHLLTVLFLGFTLLYGYAALRPPG
jgi:hypothetical protein